VEKAPAMPVVIIDNTADPFATVVEARLFTPGFPGVTLWSLDHTGRHHGVAVQVDFERQTLKPVFHLICYRLWV
jgi:hypothetical protein